MLRSVNLVVRLLCELALLVALAVWGFHAGSGLAGDLVLGLGAPLLAAVVWGLWVAPASRRRLADRPACSSRCCCSRPGAGPGRGRLPAGGGRFRRRRRVNMALDRVLA